VLSDVSRSWTVHVREWKFCQKCKIGEYADHHVFARGTLPCDVLFLGEAPGLSEDLLGYPFTGLAGKVLDGFIIQLKLRMLARSLEYSRFLAAENIFRWAITNTVLCQPVDEKGGHFREPTGQEKVRCRPRLAHFIEEVAQPKLVVCMGRHAETEALLNKDGWAGKIPLVNIRHPSYITRNGWPTSGRSKELLYADLIKVSDALKPILYKV
jgi:DNA polymerase